MNDTIKSKNQSKRHFLAKEFEITDWESLKYYFDILQNREINSVKELESWLKDYSELYAFVSETYAWKYIRMTCDTKNETIANDYQNFNQNIMPYLQEAEHQILLKYYNNPFREQLNHDTYFVYNRDVSSEIEIFRQENIPLSVQIQDLNQKYANIQSGLSVEHEGKKLTMQQAKALLKKKDRKLREEIYHKINVERKTVAEQNDEIFQELIKIRHQIAKNAGFDNFRDYRFKELGRFDYTAKDCLQFADSVKKVFLPIEEKLQKAKAKKLGLDKLKPWDLSFDEMGDKALHPFETAEELVDTSIKVLGQVNEKFGENLAFMKANSFLDLDSRDGKAPGGYNYPLHESGIPFIFMNAVGTQGDVTTMLHEAGHAVHAFLAHDLPLVFFKSTPSEVAELASMTMELLTLDYLEQFYSDKKEFLRAKREQLSRVLGLFTWVALVDTFQHWIYTHPDSSSEEINQKWLEFFNEFSTDLVDYSGSEETNKILWHKQLHIFEIPFYYVEYAMAQLGSIAVWKNYKENPETAIEQYKAALKLGYTKPIDQIYEAAGIKFDFSEEYLQELADFVYAEYESVVKALS